MKYSVAILLAMIVLFTACRSDHEDESLHRAVMVYMAADNNLGSGGYARNDIWEMMAGSRYLSKRDLLLVFVDDMSGQMPYIMKVEQGDTTRLHTFDTELDTADPAVLKQVMTWMFKHYKADDYGLVLWGHATGWEQMNNIPPASARRKAYGSDVTGGTTWMDIADMAQALNALPHLKFIFADCCCFQCIETAYELRHATDYIIASPAEIPDAGAPYDTMVPAMFGRGDDFARNMADAYYEQTLLDYKEPLSVIKTKHLELLAQATKTVLATLPPDRMAKPDINGLIYYYNHSMIDMNDFMLRHAAASDYEQWHRVFTQCVVYATMATTWMTDGYNPHVDFSDFEVTAQRYGGVSMFVYQEPSTAYLDKMNRTIGNMQWYNAAGLSALGW